MNLIQFAIELKKVVTSGKNFFLKCIPEVLDFTSTSFSGEILIYSATQMVKLPLSSDNLMSLLGLLSAAIFNEEEANVITWNFKNLMSFAMARVRGKFDYNCQIIDLKPLEKFLGIEKKAPETFHDALARVKVIMGDEHWGQAKKVYQAIHLPLITEVIPGLETLGIYDSCERKILYSYYEIEGQANGRLLCHEAYNNSFIPHCIGPSQRLKYRPKEIDGLFMYFDFHHMEVSVLQWLAHDERLGQVLNLSEDPYHVIFKLLTGNQCDTEKKREFCKRFIIGNIYGQSAKSLSEKTGISLNTAEIINDKLYKLFPSSLQWIQQRQNEVTGVCTDYFGRKRCFEERHWSVRNFVVQSPASIVCLEKLIALYHGLIGYAKLACHIHDGYVVYVSKSAAKTVAAIGKEILESESNLCTGLKLKSSCKIGATLADMKACEV